MKFRTEERRQSLRQETVRPCKAFHRPTRRFAAGQTCNLSSRGALVTLQTGRAWEVGETIDLIVAWSSRPVLPADAMVRATIVRAEPLAGDHQTIAVAFDAPAELCAAA